MAGVILCTPDGNNETNPLAQLGIGTLSPKVESLALPPDDACGETSGTALEKILSEAVQLLAMPGTNEDYSAALLAGLQARDIQHAWQLKYLTESDWEKIQISGGCVSIGLRCCISHALATQELNLGYEVPQELQTALEGEAEAIACTGTWLSRLSQQAPAAVQVLTIAGLRPREGASCCYCVYQRVNSFIQYFVCPAYWILELVNKNLHVDQRFIEGTWGNWDYTMLVCLVFLMLVGVVQRRYALAVVGLDEHSALTKVSCGAPKLSDKYAQKLERDATKCRVLSMYTCIIWIFCQVWMLCHLPDDVSSSSTTWGAAWLAIIIVAGPVWFMNQLGMVYLVRIFTIHSQVGRTKQARCHMLILSGSNPSTTLEQLLRKRSKRTKFGLPQCSIRRKANSLAYNWILKVKAIELELTERLRITQKTWGVPAVAMLLSGFILFMITLGDVFKSTSEYVHSESYWVLALWNIFGILPIWFLWMLATLYFLARITTVAQKQLEALSQSSSSSARAYARVLIEKDSIGMQIVQQRWSLRTFYGASLTVVLAAVFVIVNLQIKSLIN